LMEFDWWFEFMHRSPVWSFGSVMSSVLISLHRPIYVNRQLKRVRVPLYIKMHPN
jgi:hypothetical protein